MGEQNIDVEQDANAQRNFVRALLEDLQALERLIDGGHIESGIRRIGAEQEMFLVDQSLRPTRIAGKMLERLKGGSFTGELAQYNLEANMMPQVLGGDCLRSMERALDGDMAQARQVAASLDAKVLLVGILPTLGRDNLGLDSMTPNPRYFELNRAMSDLCDGKFETLIKGLDELKLTHDNVMLEACNTSFQIHFQTGAEEFVDLYNVAQAITGPVLAAAVNSPLLLQYRLWHETRVALFQQSLDSRSRAQKERGGAQRVRFGDSWLKQSVLEIFRDDVARFRSLIRGREEESPLELIERGVMPKLGALCLHNGTVYRWNRPCYGVKDNIAHLRIENRVLPAGPTVLDEVANAAFFYGLMSSISTEYGDVSKVLNFDNVKGNFMAAARYGLQAQMQWRDGQSVKASDLILDHLLPLAREGLKHQKIDSADIDRYLGVMEERVKSGRTGAQWALDSVAAMENQGTMGGRMRAICLSTDKQQWSGKPVHEWELATLDGESDWLDDFRTVSQIMTTDLFTVHPDDLVDLAASVMDWEHLRHVPVEDDAGQLVGVLSHRAILRLVAQGKAVRGVGAISVGEVMRKDVITAPPETGTLEAIHLMRAHKVACLPIVREGELMGIVTEHDFIEVAAGLLEEKLRQG